MSSSIYTAWSVVAGEQPTTAKWNILGTNDGSFNTGQGFNDGILIARHFGSNSVLSGSFGLASGYTGGVQSYTNTGTAGGTGYYINLGGMKMCWGTTNGLSISGAAPQTSGYGINFPSSFFTTIQSATVSTFNGVGATQFLYISSQNTPSTSGWSIWLNESTGSNGTTSASWMVIGT